MKRKSKIIISITGIFLVLLILSGLTYAYFLTNIQGNTNVKSVSITSANLQLTYNDGNGTIIGNNIVPGTTLGEKTFSVTNTGNVSVSYGVYIEDVINEFERVNDVTLTLTCTSNKPNTTCDEVSTTFPDNNRKIVTNDIASGETQTYSLIVEYIEAGVDQSVDMGKRLSGKVQIYGSERLTLEFNIANSASGDYGIIESEPKTSYATIENGTGTYRFVGVPMGSHTLTIYDENDNIKGSSPITIGTGNSTSVENTNITVPETTEEISIPVNNISVGSMELGTVKLYEQNNPYAVGTLANAIIHNAQFVTDEEKAQHYAEFRRTPLTIPGQQISRQKYEKNDGFIEVKTQSNITATKIFTYASDYTEDNTNGKFTLTNATSGVYSEIYESLVGKYIVSVTGSNSEVSSENLSEIYKVISTTSNSIVYGSVSPYVSDEQELSITEEDGGKSYYFRGGVTNNYLNFNNMCWRIVRIDKDGGVKLILASQDGECSNGTLTYDSGYIKNNTGDIVKVAYGYSTKTLVSPSGNSITLNVDNFNNGLQSYLNRWFNNKFNTNYVKNNTWCSTNNIDAYNKQGVKYELTNEMVDGNGDSYSYAIDYLLVRGSVFYYEDYINIINNNISLSCNNDFTYQSFISTLSAYEFIYSGGQFLFNGLTKPDISYIHQNVFTQHYGVNQLANTSNGLLPFIISNNGYLRVHPNVWLTTGLAVRPSIVLLPNISITGGNGSLEHPYEVE